MNENMDAVPGPDDAAELDELLGAYALDAVDDDERRRIEDHLRLDPRAAAEVRDHREVATMLAFTGMDAPEGLWARIAEEIDAEAPEPGPDLARVFSMEGRTGSDAPDRPGPVADPVSGTANGGRDVVPMRRRRTSWLLGAAAVLVLVVAGVAGVIGGSSGGVDPLDDAYADAAAADDSVRTDLVAADSDAVAVGVIDVDGHGFLDAGDLPTLDADMTYQLWGVLAETGDVVSIGILGAEPGLETFTVDGEVAALAVTIEQAPGVVSDGNPDGAYVGEFG